MYWTQPHLALVLQPPEPDERRERGHHGGIRRRDRLGGLILEYDRARMRHDTNNGALRKKPLGRSTRRGCVSR